MLDGLEVLEWLQGRDERQKLRVIVLSGSAEPAAMKKAYSLGADSYLEKPNADGWVGLIQNLQGYFSGRQLFRAVINLQPKLLIGARGRVSDSVNKPLA